MRIAIACALLLVAGSARADQVRVSVDKAREGERDEWVASITDCRRSCTSWRLPLGTHPVTFHGAVDLAGKPGPLVGTAPATKTMRKPVLVFETRETEKRTTKSRYEGNVTGTATRRDLVLIALDRDRPRRMMTLQAENIYPTGAGSRTSYRLERGKGKQLDIVAREQAEIERTSRCLRPEPIEYRWQFDAKTDRYVQTDHEGPGGCSGRGRSALPAR